MDDRAVAETIGAHKVLSTPTAEVWWKVAHGELSADEAAKALLDGREVSDHERDEVERAKLVFTPVTDARRDELLEALLARREQERRVVSLADRAVPKGRRAGKRWALGLLVVAVAVAAALVLWRQPAEHGVFLGEYTLELSGMTADMRGQEPEPKPEEIPRFRADGRIAVELTPMDDVAGSLEVVGFARGPAGEVRALELEPVFHASGKVDVDVLVGELGLHEGVWELVFAVGRAGEVPRSWEALGTGGAGHVVVRGQVRIVPER
jgi:hypothetical protein